MMQGFLPRHQEQDIFYLAGNTVQILLCFKDNGDKYYAAPAHKGWLTKRQAQEWVKRRYGVIIKPRLLEPLKASRIASLAAVEALSNSIKELEFDLWLQQEKLARLKTKESLKSAEKIQADLDAQKERLAIVKLILKRAA